MPDNDGSFNEPPIQGSNVADVFRELIRALRDIFNDWRVATAFLVMVLVAGGSMAGPDIIEGVERWIRAWRCG